MAKSSIAGSSHGSVWPWLAAAAIALVWLALTNMPSKPSPGALVLNSFPYPHKMSLSATFASPKDAQVLCGTVSGEVMKGAWNHGTRFVSDAGMGTAMIAPDGSGTPAHKAFEEKWAYYCDRS